MESKDGMLLESVRIFDLNGRVVQQTEGIGMERTSLNVSSLPNGIYIISAKTMQGTMVEKIRVQH